MKNTTNALAILALLARVNAGIIGEDKYEDLTYD